MSPDDRRWEHATAIVIGGTVAGLIVYDVVAAIKGGNEATISRFMTRTAKAHPFVPFLVGASIGHWFYSQTGRCPTCQRYTD